MNTHSLPAEGGNTPGADSFKPLNRSYREEGNFSVRVTVFGKPAPAGSKRAFYNAKLGRALVVDANANARPWKDSVTAAAVEAMQETGLLDGPLELTVVFYEPRPKGHFNSKGELNAQGLRSPRPAKKPDVLKLARGVEDAMSGVVYRDDAQIVDEHLHKRYGEPARADIRVTRLSLEEGSHGRA